MDDAQRAHAVPDTRPAGPEWRVGQFVNGKWHLDALIGVGGMAAVYSATHRNGRRAALKILYPELGRDVAIRERFLREGYLGNKIPHEGRVEVFDNDITDDGCDYLVMELLEGETLDARWKGAEGQLPVDDALAIIAQLLDFLAVCHAQGIVHRDLKPANIFVTHDARVKALDFGVAQHRDALDSAVHTRAGTALGTPNYMSPEQARGLGDKLDGRSDIFSIGAILYALLSGTRLHKGRSSDESLVMAATQPAQSIARVAPDLPVEVIALVDKALAWDRRNRFADAQEMRREVLRILGREDELEESPPSEQIEVGAAPTTAASSSESAQRIAPRHVEDDDPEIVRVRTIFKALERLLPAVRQYGWSHPEPERKLRTFFEGVVEDLRQRSGDRENGPMLCVEVRPYAITYRDCAVWEPLAPLDAIPYSLFESGMRELRIRAGVTEPELRCLVAVILTDPARDLAPEDDLATMLWDASLTHVEAVLEAGFAEGTFAQREAFHAQADELERLALEAARVADLEARAMHVATDKDALGEKGADFVILDSTTRAALATQLALPTDRWTERYVDAIVDAYLETRRDGDVELVLDPLRDSCADLVVAHRASVALDLHRSAADVIAMRCPPEDVAEIAGGLTRAVLGGPVFELVVHAIRTGAQGSPDREALLSIITTALPLLGDLEVPHALDLLAYCVEDAPHALESPELQIADAIEQYLVRVAEGHERILGARLTHERLDLGRRILAVLVRLGTPAANDLLDAIVAGPDVVLRIETLAARSSGGAAFAAELAPLVEHGEEDVRLAALRAIGRHRLREVGPVLVRKIQNDTFHALRELERREMLAALFALNPSRAEGIAIELLASSGMLRGESREQSRVVAARQLGAYARSQTALDAIKQARSSFFGVSEALKTALEDAAQAVGARLAPPTSTEGALR